MGAVGAGYVWGVAGNGVMVVGVVMGTGPGAGSGPSLLVYGR